MPCVPAKLVPPERAPPSRMVREAMHERISERISGPGLGNCGCEGHFATHSILIPSTQWHPLSVIRPRLINELRWRLEAHRADLLSFRLDNYTTTEPDRQTLRRQSGLIGVTVTDQSSSVAPALSASGYAVKRLNCLARLKRVGNPVFLPAARFTSTHVHACAPSQLKR
jgi:hypothetical protein